MSFDAGIDSANGSTGRFEGFDEAHENDILLSMKQANHPALADVVESGGGEGAANIKSHHNVGGLPEDLQFELVEPLRTLFKDEVRAIGRELGLPAEIVGRQPFPGPGLGIRIVGEVTKDRLDLLRKAVSLGAGAPAGPTPPSK